MKISVDSFAPLACFVCSAAGLALRTTTSAAMASTPTALRMNVSSWDSVLHTVSFLEILPNPTAVFVAGLEGTGHHLMGAVLDKLIERETPSVCTKNLMLSSKVVEAIFPSEDGNTNMLSDALKSIATTLKPQEQLVALNCVSGISKPSMMSYPDVVAGDISPDMVRLQEAATDAGVELRVLVTVRGTAGMLRNGCVDHNYAHSGHHRCKADAMRLRKHGQMMLEQLQALPRSHVMCIQYEDFLAHADQISSYLGEELGTIMGEVYQPSASVGNLSHHVEEAAELFEPVAQELEKFCSSVQQLSAMQVLSALRAPVGWPSK